MTEQPPIACTLTAASVGARVEEWARLLGTGVTSRAPIDGGLRLQLGPAADVAEIVRLAIAEHDCCRFFAFTVTVDARGVALEVTAPTDGLPVLTELFGAPTHTTQEASVTTNNDVEDEVRAYYAAAAVAAGGGAQACCGPQAEQFGAGLYDDLDGLPDAAALASIGCGNPTAVADLRPGEVVLDLGSGGGIDVLLSARRVGPTGRAYGVDFTAEMLDLARRNAADSGATNVEFLDGRIEAVPLPDESIDVVISNCVINLSTDKPAVFAEVHRLLRPGGRIGVSDVVTEDRLSATERAERGGHVGCIAGALSVNEYQDQLVTAGFDGVSIELTHAVGDGVHAAIVRAVKPAAG